MFKHILMSVLLLSSASTWATGQMGESIEFEGKNYYTHGFPPLDSKIPHGRGGCTALWRGYLGSWVIADRQLYLKQVITHLPTAEPNPLFEKLEKSDNHCAGDYQIDLEKIYGHKAPIPATWFTGYLALNDGERLEYVHMGFASTYERNILLHFKNGRLTQKTVTDNTASFKKCGSVSKQFGEFYETNQQKPVAQQVNPDTWKPTPECASKVILDEQYSAQ
jgi:hypothetical protein